MPRDLAGSALRGYTIPALALAVLLSGGALAAAALLIARPIWGTLLSAAYRRR